MPTLPGARSPRHATILTALWVAIATLWCPRPALAAPAVEVPTGTTYLDDVGYYDVSVEYRDGTSVAFPMGWVGHFEDATGISITPFGRQDGKDAFLEHPPWRARTGRTNQVFRLTLPTSPRILLRFGTAMQKGAMAAGQSDGARFHVEIDGTVILDQLKTDEQWSEWKANLTAYAGKTITLTFTIDPGPKDNAAFDFALWGSRRILVDGGWSQTVTDIPSTPTNLAKVTRFWDGDGPSYPAEWPSSHWLRSAVTHDAGGFLAGWSARLPGQAPISLATGAYLLFVAPDGSYVRSDDPSVSVTCTESFDSSLNTIRRVSGYSVGERTIRVTTNFHFAQGGATRVDVSSDDPYIATVCFGEIGPVALRRTVHVPYYGPILYLQRERAFANVFVDFTKSQASDIAGSVASYRPRTDGSRNAVRETTYFAVSPDLTSALPTPPNAPSGQIANLSGRVVYDLFDDAPFRESAAFLRELQTYGLGKYVVIEHTWQRAGYDVELPAVIPANIGHGGDTPLQELSRATADMGGIFALHENYEDFYPESKGYDPSDVAKLSDGTPVPSWKNKTQSYAYKATAITKYAAVYSPQIHKLYGTSGSFIDVSSSVEPWFHVDFNAAESHAGQFRSGYDARTKLLAYERATHGGPVVGEGGNHWPLSGLLDGVEAQSNAYAPANLYGVMTPLLVDFDLTKVHPLQLNHGMGYISRWMEPVTSSGGDGTLTARDKYRMQEIAFGHQGFIGTELTRDLAFIWQESNLLPAITTRTATAIVTSVQYDVDGAMVDVNAAVAARSAFDRVKVSYDNGVEVWANGRSTSWAINDAGVVLPESGWCVKGTDILSYFGLLQGRKADYSETPDCIFAGTRADPTTGPADGVINYGKVATDASVRVRRETAGAWSLVTFPRTEAFIVRLDAARIDPAFTSLKVTGYDAGDNRIGESQVVKTPEGWYVFKANTLPGVTHYRLTAGE